MVPPDRCAVIVADTPDATLRLLPGDEARADRSVVEAERRLGTHPYQ